MFEWERLERARNEGIAQGIIQGVEKGIQKERKTSIVKSIKMLKSISIDDDVIIENICREFEASKEEVLCYLESANKTQ